MEARGHKRQDDYCWIIDEAYFKILEAFLGVEDEECNLNNLEAEHRYFNCELSTAHLSDQIQIG